MATKDQKYKALKAATDIAADYAKGGSGGLTPDAVLKAAYQVILEIVDEIEKSSS